MAFFFADCKKEYAIEVYHTFPGNRWSRFEKIEFEVPVQSTDSYYDIYLCLKHDSTYPYKNLYINVVMFLPSGETRIREYDFDVKDEDGFFVAQMIQGKGENVFLLRKEIKFTEPGICLFEIEDLIPRIDISGIHQLGILMKKSKPED